MMLRLLFQMYIRCVCHDKTKDARHFHAWVDAAPEDGTAVPWGCPVCVSALTTWVLVPYVRSLPQASTHHARKQETSMQ